MANRLNVQNIYASDSDTTAAVQVSGANVTLNGTANDLGTVSAGTIGTGVTINAGSNVSGIGQLIGISRSNTAANAEGSWVTLENSKTYHMIAMSFRGGTTNGEYIEYYKLDVNSSGTVTKTEYVNITSKIDADFTTNAVRLLTTGTASDYGHPIGLVFEEGSTMDYL